MLDVRQRLTAMYNAFVGINKRLPNRSSRAHYLVRIDRFMAEEYDETFTY